jgi:cold shock CspA family protein
MPQGTIKDFDLSDEVGLLLQDDRSEVYIDAHSLVGSDLRYLRIGQRVKYEVEQVYGRPTARNLRHITF